MTLKDYEIAGKLLLQIQRLEELLAEVITSEEIEYKSEYRICINGLNTIVSKQTKEEIERALKNELIRYKKEFKDL